jgi:hypothetical protein
MSDFNNMFKNLDDSALGAADLSCGTVTDTPEHVAMTEKELADIMRAPQKPRIPRARRTLTYH